MGDNDKDGGQEAAEVGAGENLRQGLSALGTHLLVELRDCNQEVLNSVDSVREIMVGAARHAGATIVDASFHEFNPFGVSGMVIIAESHLSIHTWPEYGYAAVDVFTCGELIKPIDAAQYLIEKFGSKGPSVVEMKRGILMEVKNLRHKVVGGTAPTARKTGSCNHGGDT